jgi:hypothetical protein
VDNGKMTKNAEKSQIFAVRVAINSVSGLESSTKVVRFWYAFCLRKLLCPELPEKVYQNCSVSVAFFRFHFFNYPHLKTIMGYVNRSEPF